MKEMMEWVKQNWPESIAAIFMILGIIFSFFNPFFSGILVGLAFGFVFAEEIHALLSKIKELIAQKGTFKTLIAAGTLLFLLIVLTSFVIATAVGYGIVLLIQWVMKKKE